MKVLETNNIIAFDCDQTLVLWPKDPTKARTGTIPFEYGGETVYLYPHWPHIRFLKHCYLRGDYISIWSKNGWIWAKQVAEKLELQAFTHEVRSKPDKHVDDKTQIADIVGDRIFLSFEPGDE